MKRGYFLTLEGIEGVGKSTHLPFIRHYLEKMGVSAIVTREPGGTPVAEGIRRLLLTQHHEIVTQQTELLLFFAGRAQHISHVIQPALNTGQWVICDRFTDTTYAYQGYGRGMSMDQIKTLEKWVQGDLQPSWVLLFDAPVRTALKRMKNRKLDRIETEREDFFQRVRNGYLARAKLFPDRYKIIDASVTLAKVRNQISEILDALVKHFTNFDS